MADVFISYRQTERSAVEQIAERLRTLGFDVWFDARLIAGDSFNDEIDREARSARAILVCWSPAARESKWVKAEAMIGFEEDKLAACYVAGPDRFSAPAPFNTTHSGDLRTWLEKLDNADPVWRSVVQRVAELCGRDDVVSWCQLDKHSSINDFRAWITRYTISPLFLQVDAQLQAREEAEAQRERAEQEARDRRAREEEARRRREEEDRRLREAAERAAAEQEERAQQEEEQRQAEEGERKRAEAARQFRRGLLLLSPLAILSFILLAWQYVSSLPTPQERAAAEREAAALRTEHLAFTEPYLAHEARELRVANGEQLEQMLIRAGASSMDSIAASTAVRTVYDPRRLRPGQSLTVFFSRRSGEAVLSAIAFRSEPGASVTAQRLATGVFVAREILMPVRFEIARISAEVGTSLYSSALREGATDREIAALADAFGYDVDFQRDVRPDHRFEMVFERFYDDEGNTVRTGELLFVALETDQGVRNYYQFLPPGALRPDWYDAAGRNAGRLLIRTPVTEAILARGYTSSHRGLDFTAPVGTPVLAAGDGVVTLAGLDRSHGNYVRIRHAGEYETGYSYLSRFARGIREGVSVGQGQVIGYVGTWDASTYPHLHYEVWRSGQQISPATVSPGAQTALTGQALGLFQIERARIDTLRQVRAREARDRSSR
jgi:murein DD-endopeptidase MepM/ murein hydrolase activator NlpD